MGWQVVMSLLESVILLDEMKVISSQDNGSVHLVGENDSLEKSTSDGNAGGEWALVVNICSLNGCLWGFETKTNSSVVSWGVGLLLGEDSL